MIRIRAGCFNVHMVPNESHLREELLIKAAESSISAYAATRKRCCEEKKRCIGSNPVVTSHEARRVGTWSTTYEFVFSLVLRDRKR